MFLQNSQLVIEILLMVVLILGIVSSRLIVRRLGVIRESYTALNEMVSTLDSSTEQVNHMFERVRHEVSQGDKRLSVLLERARNVEEDLLDQKKMAGESSESLSDVLSRAEERESALKEKIGESQALLKALEDQLKAQKEALEQAEKATESAIKAKSGMSEADISETNSPETGAAEREGLGRDGQNSRVDGRVTLAENGESRPATPVDQQSDMTDDRQEAAGNGPSEGAGKEDKAADLPHFSDKVNMPVPGRLRRPRPYLRNKDLDGQKAG